MIGKIERKVLPVARRRKGERIEFASVTYPVPAPASSQPEGGVKGAVTPQCWWNGSEGHPRKEGGVKGSKEKQGHPTRQRVCRRGFLEEGINNSCKRGPTQNKKRGRLRNSQDEGNLSKKPGSDLKGRWPPNLDAGKKEGEKFVV